MNLTLSVDDQVVERARKVASGMGTSLNQMVRLYLEQLAGQGDVEEEIRELRRLSEQGQGRSRGWKFRRDELYERS